MKPAYFMIWFTFNIILSKFPSNIYSILFVYNTW